MTAEDRAREALARAKMEAWPGYPDEASWDSVDQAQRDHWLNQVSEIEAKACAAFAAASLAQAETRVKELEAELQDEKRYSSQAQARIEEMMSERNALRARLETAVADAAVGDRGRGMTGEIEYKLSYGSPESFGYVRRPSLDTESGNAYESPDGKIWLARKDNPRPVFARQRVPSPRLGDGSGKEKR